MAEIDLVHVTKRFPDGTTAVDDATFTIADGEFFILVGPSGCGKSTLLNMIVGLEDISEGELKVDGKVVNDVDPKDRNMAMVFQSYALYPHMTVRENIAFPLKLAKMPEDRDRQAGGRGGPHPRSSTSCSTASRPTSPAASASGWPWAGPSCGSRRRSSWTSPCPTSTPSSGCRPAPRSPASRTGSRPPPSTSPTTRPRP